MNAIRLAVGRITGDLIASRAVGDLPQIAFLGRRGEDLAVNRERDAPARGREIVVVGLRVEVAHFGDVLLGLGGDVQLDRRDFARWPTSSFQMPKSCSKTITLPSALIAGQAHVAGLEEVTRSALPPASGTRQMLVRPLPSRSLTK